MKRVHFSTPHFGGNTDDPEELVRVARQLQGQGVKHVRLGPTFSSPTVTIDEFTAQANAASQESQGEGIPEEDRVRMPWGGSYDRWD